MPTEAELKGDVLALFDQMADTRESSVRAEVQAQIDAALQRAAQAEADLAHAQTEVAALTAQVTDLQAQLAEATRPPLLVGARINDITWDQAVADLGPLKVTRLFHKALPATLDRQGIPQGVRLIISYKAATSANLESFLKSIGPDDDVELVYHHEAEADYPSGSTFVAEFNAAQAAARKANPAVPFGFIAGGFQYRTSKLPGWDGSFIPPAADRYYLDSYQRGGADNSWSPIQPAETDPAVQRYLTLLASKGLPFHGFTEYGRGCVDLGTAIPESMVQQRLDAIAADRAYLATLPDLRVWSYWNGNDAKTADGTIKQWRLTDARSQAAWRSIAQG